MTTRPAPLTIPERIRIAKATAKMCDVASDLAFRQAEQACANGDDAEWEYQINRGTHLLHKMLFNHDRIEKLQGEG